MTSRQAMAQVALSLLLTIGCARAFGPGTSEGADAGPLLRDSGIPDPPAVDAAIEVPACEPEDATMDFCPEFECDGPDTWHWNGDTCVPVRCGTCVGSDCDRGALSEEDCLDAHALCPPSLCRETEGTWRFWGEDCGHFVCGSAPPQTCLIGTPSCDCGLSRQFVEGVGCVEEEACPDPPDRAPRAACESTGGLWGDFCCASVCGEFCPDACLAPACHCGPGRVFDEGRGCIEATRCFDRRANETCLPHARCEAGTLCCPADAGEPVSVCRPPQCGRDDLCP